jgi:phage gp36-like protein
MMAYCTLAQLTDRYGLSLLIDVSHRDGARPAEPDAALFARVIADADALIDSYLKGRYQLPIAGAVPPVLTDLSQTIALYKAHSSVAGDKIRKDYEDALKTLKDIGSGAARLDVAGAEPAASGASGARITDRERPFTEKNLEGWI